MDTVKVSPAYGRTVKLYRYDTAEKRFVLERSFTTANKKTARVDVRYPASWKGYAKSIWKIDVPAVKAVKKKVTFKVEADSSAGDAESSDAGDGESAKSSKSTKKSTSKTKTKTIVVRKAMARASAKVKVRCAFLSCKAGVVLDIIGVFAVSVPLVYFLGKALMGV